MKVSELIKKLQDIMVENGDLDVIVVTDFVDHKRISVGKYKYNHCDVVEIAAYWW